MEEYLLFFAIGGLLFLTLFVNSVSEAYEQKQREKRLKILRIKRGLDELSDILEKFNDFQIKSTISQLLSSEIMARLQAIQKLDKNFRGIETLLTEVDTHNEANKAAPIPTVISEQQYQEKIKLFRCLIKRIHSHQWYSANSEKTMHQYHDEAQLLRAETINQYYTGVAQKDSEKKAFLLAKEHYNYIIHALKQSPIHNNTRILEIIEQTEFMLEQLNQQQLDHEQTHINKNLETEAENKDNEKVQDNIEGHQANVENSATIKTSADEKPPSSEAT